MASAAEKTTLSREAQTLQATTIRKALANGSDSWEGINVEIKHIGPHITLPAEPVAMELATAITTLQRKLEEEEKVVGVHEHVDAFPQDGAVAFQKAMQRKFGWVSAVPTPGFFGSDPPTTIDIEIGVNERISVVWGRFELPGVSGFVQTGAHPTPKGLRFIIAGEVKRKHHKLVVELAQLTREIADKESIYRHKAVHLTVGEDGSVNWMRGIAFTDMSGIHPEELVFSETTSIQINTSLWTLIEKTARCRRHQIPLKRGVLMEGDYGTGKSFASAVTALKAVANGWTFMSIDRVSGLAEALHFARKYQPCVIFAEDVDQIMSGQDRTTSINDVLNTIDGIASKGTEILVVLTTNHVERISRPLLRPGRLDAVITITPPDTQAVKRLIRLYGRSLVAADDPLDRSGEMLNGRIPAMIRECTERAKLYAIQRSDDDENLTITDDDVYHAAIGLKPHMDLLTQSVEEKREPSLMDMIRAAVDSAESMKKVVEYVGELTTKGGAGVADKHRSRTSP